LSDSTLPKVSPRYLIKLLLECEEAHCFFSLLSFLPFSPILPHLCTLLLHVVEPSNHNDWSILRKRAKLNMPKTKSKLRESRSPASDKPYVVFLTPFKGVRRGSVNPRQKNNTVEKKRSSQKNDIIHPFFVKGKETFESRAIHIQRKGETQVHCAYWIALERHQSFNSRREEGKGGGGG